MSELRVTTIAAVCMLLFAISCSSPVQLTNRDLDRLLKPETELFAAELRVDARNGTYRVKAGDLHIERNEHGAELVGFGRTVIENTKKPLSIPLDSVQRIWYYKDITVDFSDGFRETFKSGTWHLSYKKGRATRLVSVLYDKDLKTGKIDRSEQGYRVRTIMSIATEDALSPEDGPGLGAGLLAVIALVVLGALTLLIYWSECTYFE